MCNNCPWNHKMGSSSGVDVAAAPGGPGPHEPGHPAYRATMCRNIAEQGKCSFGDNCSFSHDTSSKKSDNTYKQYKKDNKDNKDNNDKDHNKDKQDVNSLH
eukprot:7185883-Heterocapsa_arctica.AAC.1